MEDYLQITLTDEDDVPDAMAKLRTVYPNLLRILYDNRRTRSAAAVEAQADVPSLSPMELFARFYEMQNGRPLSEEQSDHIRGRIEKIWEGGV